MKYQSVQKAQFISRPNRFIAHATLNGEEVIAHVKNTGRCKELLLPGATVYLEPSDNPNRKTRFSLIAVEKGELLVNIDSQAPNQVVENHLQQHGILEGLPAVTDYRREYTHGNSRLDFLLQTKQGEMLVEVKGVTLEQDGTALFPDAPTQRGVKHIEELTHSLSEGYQAALVFVLQMEGMQIFRPNWNTHPEFGHALHQAQKQGVHVLAYGCSVSPDTLVLTQRVPIDLTLPAENPLPHRT